MASSYPRGSEWRRWDLHVHTPASALENQFRDWDSYLDALENKARSEGIAVIGVTDYCSIEGYKWLRDAQGTGRLSGVLLIPNVEFRISVQTRAGGAINLHFLFSPDAPDHVEHIERVLSNLSFQYKGSPYKCSRSELTRLGRDADRKQTDDRGAYQHGVKIFKPEFGAFKNWWESEQWLRENALIVIDNGTSDGASGLAQDGGYQAVREEFYRFAHMVFSPRSKCRTYFLGQGCDPSTEVKRKCGKLMPCIHGSDAHDIDKLFAPDEQRHCWIKADPTFDGLRQILYEPEERVYIGETPPGAYDDAKIISEVEFTNADAWFPSSKIQLNSGLVTIVGEKGSGKTALADSIADACGAWRPSPTSFLSKAKALLGDARITVRWQNGALSEGTLAGTNGEKPAQVRYLSQDFVERLCSQDHTGSDLLNEIEDVIFAYIEEEDRLGASSFHDLRVFKTEAIQKKRHALRAQISALNSEIVELEDGIALRPQKEKRISVTEAEIAAIEKQTPELEAASNQEVVEKLGKERVALQGVSGELALVSRNLEHAKTVRDAVANMQQVIESEFAKARPLLDALGLSISEAERFRPTFSDDFDATLLEKEEQLRTKQLALKGNPDAPTADGHSVADIRARIEQLELGLSQNETQRKRLVELQQAKAKLGKEREKLLQEIGRIDKEQTEELKARRVDRMSAYLKYFDLLSAEEETLGDLYGPLGKHLDPGHEDARGKFELGVRRVVNAEAWATTGDSLIDRRKTHPFRGSGELTRWAQEHLVPHWSTQDPAQLEAGLLHLQRELQGSGESVSRALLSHATRAQFYDWLFSAEHISISYGLKYDGVELEYLSPGTRGILLLVLYLEMDKNDRRPLIIDQPEGNLDNSSIFDSLVPYLRRAKRKRQVMLVTHNPNLVVTTDAEQIIVASASKNGHRHPTITYQGGAIEHSAVDGGTRQAVCRLLEGGEDAFRRREEKYALKA